MGLIGNNFQAAFFIFIISSTIVQYSSWDNKKKFQEMILLYWISLGWDIYLDEK